MDQYTRFRTISSIIQDKKGAMWFSTEGSGVFHFDAKENKMISVSKKEGLSSEFVSSLCEDNLGNIWMGTENGITIYDPKFDISAASSYNYINVAAGIATSDITCMSLVQKNEMWIGTKDAGIFILKITDDFSVKNIDASIAQKLTRITTDNGLSSNNIKAIYQDNENRIWIGTKNGGVIQFTPAVFGAKKATQGVGKYKTFSVKQGLNYYNANSIFQDREGNVWIGTDVGLNQFRGERFQIFDEKDNLVNNIVWSILTDKDGNIWIGTNAGLTKVSIAYPKDENSVTSYIVQNFSTKDGLTSDVILAMHEDENGDIWLGTGYGGVSKYRKAENKFVSMNNETALENITVYAINSDADGNLWFGTKAGATKYNPTEVSSRNFTTEDGLGGNNIYRIFRDSKNRIWFGALGGNLSSFDGNGFKKYDEKLGIKHRFILCMTEDRSGNMWFGAYGGGLYKYDSKNFYNYTMEDGLSSQSPYAIIADEINNIWIGSTQGIDKLDTKKNSLNHYGKEEGFLGVEINPNAICTDKEGNIWFGTIMGAAKFNPKEDRPNKTEPLTSITGIKIFLRDTLFPVDAKFDYAHNHITFNFIGISLTNPSKVKYEYKLEGFDKDWSPSSTLNEAVYSNVPPGDYTFLVRASNNDGIWNSKPAEYKFSVLPPFYLTKWFYTLCAVAALLLFYIFDKIRVRNLQAQKRFLAKKVEERTAEIAQKNQELAEKNKDITDSIRYAKRIQEAILPQSRVVRQIVPDSFILYKPKDIVSGDFYWLNKKDETALVAAVDCTGHGVPGAFMSIVGHNLLNKVVDETKEIIPAQILDKLNEGVSETLKKSIEDYGVKDGMDISLIAIDFLKKELQFSGAFNPMYLVRKGDLTEIKGDNIAIGTWHEDKSKKYNNHTFALEKDDVIYIFSDGFADQFGGPGGKKYKYNQFKSTLAGISRQPMKEQQEILSKIIEEWRGKHEQVDDMLVIGIKI